MKTTALFQKKPLTIGLMSVVASFTFAGTWFLAYQTANAEGGNTGLPNPALIVDNAGISQIDDSNQILNALKVATSQTSIEPSQVGNATLRTSQIQTSAEIAQRVAFNVAKAAADSTFGDGLSRAAGCEVQTENTGRVVNLVAEKDMASRAMVNASSNYFQKATDKKTLRALTHLQNYCDLTETLSGTCIPKADGMQSADTNYNTIASHTLLSPEQEQASYSFVVNLIDPSSTQETACPTQSCETSTANERATAALSSMSQSAYVNQIHDSLVFDVTGRYDYTKAPDVVSSVAGTQGSTILGSTVVSGTPVTTPNSSSGSSNRTGNIVETKLSDLYVIGDSIAVGFATLNGQKILKGQQVGGKNTRDVLEFVQDTIDDYDLKGKTVILSSGYTNEVHAPNTHGSGKYSSQIFQPHEADDKKNIAQQITLLKQAGANVILLGMSSNITYLGADPIRNNQELSDLAASNGAVFAGSFTAGKDKTHPASYNLSTIPVLKIIPENQ